MIYGPTPPPGIRNGHVRAGRSVTSYPGQNWSKYLYSFKGFSAWHKFGWEELRPKIRSFAKSGHSSIFGLRNGRSSRALGIGHTFKNRSPAYICVHFLYFPIVDKKSFYSAYFRT